jgi:hypothetical protein
MAKSSPTATDLFSIRELERIYELLKSESIEGFWEVGRLLNARLGERAPYGALAKLNVELPKLGDDAPTSLAQLHQCRRLNATWKKADVNAAKRAGLPWGRAIVLIYIWSVATKPKRRQPKIVKQCRKLIAEYGGLGWNKKGAWNVAVKALQKQARAGNGFSKLRLLGEKRVAVILRLKTAAQMIDEMREFLPAEAHTECLGLKAQAEGLIPLVEMLCERHMPAGQ